MQIKGEKQLAEPTESVQHMSDKFNDFEKDRKKKEEMINNLKEEVSTLKGRVQTLEREGDGQEQYSKRKCKLVHGIEENKYEVTDDLVVNFMKNNTDFELSVKNIE